MGHLALCIVTLAAGYAKAASIPQCCKEKTVGGVPYILVDETDTMKYGCKSNCVFEKKDNPGKRFCFKVGDLEAVCDEEDDYSSTFDEFIQKNKKTYKSEEEKLLRQEIWKAKVQEIIQHNKEYDEGKVSFKLGENEYTDLSYSELLSTITGLILNATQSRKQEEQRIDYLTNIPASVDWRTKGYVTPVKNQGQCGSCWAFSATGAMEGAWKKSKGELISFSEQNILDCNKRGRGCNGGWMSYAFEYAIDNDGIEAESTYPYEANQGECKYDVTNRAATMESYSYVAKSEDDLMKIVATVGPVSVAIQVQNSFFGYRSGIYYDPTCPTNRANHAVLVVGYGTDGSGQKYWIVKNSWGTSWGDGGYIYMARDKGNLCGIANYAVYPQAPKQACSASISVEGAVNGFTFTGTYIQQKSYYNDMVWYKSNFKSPNQEQYWCIFNGGNNEYGGFWKVDVCGFPEQNLDWSRGYIWSKIKAMCPENIGANWRYYSWGSAGSGSGPIDPSIVIKKQDSPLHMLSSPMKNGYSGDPMLEAALDEDSDTLGDSLDDLIITKH